MNRCRPFFAATLVAVTFRIAVVIVAGVLGAAVIGNSPAAGAAETAEAASPAWGQWRGPARDGVFAGGQWPATLDGSLSLAWEVELGPSYSGPVSSGGLVFTTETVDKRLERVTALKLDGGEKVWSVEWEGSMAVPFFAASNGDWIRATPACDGENLVVAGMRDVVVCLDPRTGDEKWRVDFAKSLGSPLQAFGCVCSPIIDGDAVYIQAGGGTTKLALADGKVIWQTLKDGGGMMTGGAFSSPIIATIAGERQLVVATRESLAGVSLEDGRTLWNEPIESFRGMNILTPVVVGGRLFSSAHSGRSRMFEVVGEAGSAAAVNEVWDNKAQAYMSTPVVVGDHLYMHLKNQRFVCMDAAEGTEKWTTEPFGKYWSMVSNPESGMILALESEGQLRQIAADPERFRVISETKVADDSWAHLAVQPVSDGEGFWVMVRALDRLRVYRWQ
jgi:outer membrane protein assembly factor BamB